MSSENHFALFGIMLRWVGNNYDQASPRSICRQAPCRARTVNQSRAWSDQLCL